MIIDHEVDSYAIDLRGRLQECITSILSSNHTDQINKLFNVIGIITSCIVYHHIFICNTIYNVLIPYINENHVKGSFGRAMLHNKYMSSQTYNPTEDAIQSIISVLYKYRIISSSDRMDFMIEIGSYRY